MTVIKDVLVTLSARLARSTLAGAGANRQAKTAEHRKLQLQLDAVHHCLEAHLNIV
jgi:hypothetical protein